MSPADSDDRDDSARYPADSAAIAAAFEDIVARWQADGGVPSWPDDQSMSSRQHHGDPGRPEVDRVADRVVPSEADRVMPSDADWAVPPEVDRLGRPRADRGVPSEVGRAVQPASEDDHFVPPEPPPLPRIGRSAAVGVGLLVVGLLLSVAPDLLGMTDSIGLSLGLLILAGGLGWLVRSWSGDSRTDDGDENDGAVL